MQGQQGKFLFISMSFEWDLSPLYWKLQSKNLSSCTDFSIGDGFADVFLDLKDCFLRWFLHILIECHW